MRFESIELKGYIGLYQGTLKTDIKINFGKNRITMITGPNGSGKSTLQKAMTIYPDSNKEFISGQPAEKEIVLIEKGIRYKVNCIHGITDKGQRATAKAYIKRFENGQWIEYNPTGTITSYKDFIESEFDMDPNFVSLAALSTEDKGLVEKTPSERKKYVNGMIEYVGVYNNIHKVLTKRSSVYKSLINSLVSKIDIIGDEEQLVPSLNQISSRIEQAKKDKSSIEEIISMNKAQIQIIDPDSSIQHLYSSIHIELERANNSIRQLEKDIEYLYSHNNLSTIIDSKAKSSKKCSAIYSDYNDRIITLKASISNYESELSNYLVDREEQARALQIKSSRIESLKSEFNYDSLKESIKVNEEIIANCEKIFKDINIKNAINISKDEYILGLNTMNDIKDNIRSIQSSNFGSDIELAIYYVTENTLSLPNKITELEDKVKLLENEYETLSNQYSYYSGLSDQVKILSDRPDKCKIDSCPFISSALLAYKENPDDRLKELEILLAEKKNEIDSINKELSSHESALEIYHNLNNILRNINNSKSILSKLPNSDIFLDKNKFFEEILKGANFEQINQLYKYIDYANIFEEYKTANNILKDLKAEEKIYDTKAKALEDLAEDIFKLNEKLDSIVSKIESTQEAIQDDKVLLDEYISITDSLDKLLVILRSYEEAIKTKEEAEQKLETISSNMDKINNCLELIEEAKTRLDEQNSILTALEEEKSSIKYSIAMVKQYKEELTEYEKSYAIIETIKEYSSPTKKGIQNLFIKVYMAQTLKLANNLLGLFFGNRLSLLPYNIDENSFSIPCFSRYTGLTTDDVSNCSRSEKAMIGLALSGALLKQASSKFNIFRIDEIDEGLDAENRLQFIHAVNTICDLLEIEQFIMISHSSELGLQNVDIIRLKEGTEVNGIDGNIICSL